jgi:hypothetical protein
MGITIEEFEARRAARKKGVDDAARKAQEGIDLEAIDALEEEHGWDIDVSLRVRNAVAGLPVVLGVRRPTAPEYKRFFQSVNRAGNADAKMAAHAQLAEVCWVYPADKGARETLLEANPGLMAGAGNVAIKLAELEVAETGKG